MKAAKLPDFSFEKKINKKFLVVGVDEVGRGAIAGPVVAGACAISNFKFLISKKDSQPFDWLELGIDDSKRLTQRRREELAKIIQKNSIWGIGEASVSCINNKGIVKATEKAMRASLANLKLCASAEFLRTHKYKISNLKLHKNFQIFVLVDAFHVKYVPGVGLRNQKAIIKGDQKSISIAAASIIAKVHRDKLMTKLHKKYSRYGWKQSKGYGTEKHWQAVKKYGITRLHRKKFVESGLKKADRTV